MITFVIPVYRSAEILPRLYSRLVGQFDNWSCEFELIFVEDCGGDQSWNIIRELAKKDPRVSGFRMRQNCGQHNALLCGIRSAKGDIIVTLDDDLQHPPEEIPKLLAKLDDGFDVVYGPPQQETHGLLRNFASQITKFALEEVMGAANARQVSALRAFRSCLREAFTDFRSPWVNIDVLLTWATSSFTSVPVRHEMRLHGRSGYTFLKLMRHANNMITGFSTRPLQLASMLGFCLAFFGFSVLGYVFSIWLINGSAVPGFAFLASIIAIFSGGQLIALGIMGEYLARMYMRSMEQPPYFVRETTINKIQNET